MVFVSLHKLETFLRDLLEGCGLTCPDSEAVTDVVIRATMRGVKHHDLYLFPNHLRALLEGRMNARPSFETLESYHALECWEGDNGLGEICCSFLMERACRLADRYGVGVCVMRNTNHFLAAAPYVERASEQGYLALLLAKGDVSMGAPGRPGRCMGQLPMGYAAPTGGTFPLMMDICMANVSLGALDQMAERGERVPEGWGLAPDASPTTDPMMLRAGTRFPIGGHKGFGLAMLGEVLTGVLGRGAILDRPEGENFNTHTAIVIKPDTVLNEGGFKRRMDVFLERVDELSPGLHIPGAGNYRSKQAIVENGGFTIDDTLVGTLNGLAAQVGRGGLV